MRIAAIGDLHAQENGEEALRSILRGVKDRADVLVVAGDLTDNGRPAEARIAAKCFKELDMPIVGVLGNHDHESNQENKVAKIISDAGVCLLDGSVYELSGVGFVGTKGFCGGFDKLFIQPFGERVLKTFIQVSIDEAIRLEKALSTLVETQHKVAILHYSPIRETLRGEPPELYPFLGTSLLASPLDRLGVDVIFHGHAHHGSSQGTTPGGIPVHNASRFVQISDNGRPYCFYDIG